MAFTWKDNGKIFVGEGIYHLTFVVASESLKLGTVRGRSKEEIAAVVQPVPYKSKFDDQCRRFINAHYKVVLMSRAKFVEEALREIENECGEARPSVT